MGIRIRSLRLIGITKNYEVSFVAGDRPRALSVVAGEISTGKSSVPEFIDYCLGASEHPRYQEVQRKVRSALLEIEASGQVYVIERPLFSHDRVAWLHHCSLAQIGEPHSKNRKPLDPSGQPGSLSMFLLDHCGLAGINLKEAPAQTSSGVDVLSFRDLMWLSFLQNTRLDSRQLMHEANYMQRIKLQQVVEVVFGVHDDQMVQLGNQLKNLEERRRALDTEIESLNHFLTEQGVPQRDVLAARIKQLDVEETTALDQLTELDTSLTARTGFAHGLRQQYAQQSTATRQAATVVRDRDTLLRRLLPLRGQYAEDERKLVFYEGARQLFDPLRVVVCPGCLQSLPTPVSITDGRCSLCGQSMIPEDDAIDVQVELNAVRRRRRAIELYIHEVERALEEAQVVYRQAVVAEADAQRQLDTVVANSVAPFIGERDVLVRRREDIRAELSMLLQQRSWLEGLDHRGLERARLAQQIDAVRVEIRELQKQGSSRATVISTLSARFRSILEEFGFPKLSDPEPPFLDQSFVPFVRGNAYRAISSSGGLTLISLAWMLSIFELATEGRHPHPGFLMIDSPQKNLRPNEGQAADEFRDPTIVERVWRHILNWSSGSGSSFQLIVVDNAPPPTAESSVIARYSGRPEIYPYGLIDDETS